MSGHALDLMVHAPKEVEATEGSSETFGRVEGQSALSCEIAHVIFVHNVKRTRYNLFQLSQNRKCPAVRNMKHMGESLHQYVKRCGTGLASVYVESGESAD